MENNFKSKRTVKGKIMLFTLVLTAAMILNVSAVIAVQVIQSQNNISAMLDESLAGSQSTVSAGISGLSALVTDHVYDYEFLYGTADAKAAHAKEIASRYDAISSAVFVSSDGNAYGGELPSSVKNKLSAGQSVFCAVDNSSFAAAIQSREGNIFCAVMSNEVLKGLLSGCKHDTAVLASDGSIIASAGSFSGDVKSYAQSSGKSVTNLSPKGESGTAYSAASLSGTDNWTILVKVNTSDFYLGTNRTFVASAVMVVMFIILGLLANSYFNKKVNVPLDKIRVKIVEMSRGNISGAPVDYSGTDDLGELSAAVNMMAESNLNLIGDIRYTAEEIAKENLCVKPRVAYQGDYVPVKNALENIVETVRDVVSNIEQAGREVSAGSEQMSNNSAVLSRAADEEAQTVTQLNDSLNRIYSEISENAEKSCRDANETARECMELVNEGNNDMAKMLDAMNEINSTSSQIANIIKTIQDISEQTNILSINASIEAARVGAAGKGFAVVAGEVGRLADKTASAAKSTTALIETAIRAVKNGTVVANETAGMLEKIVEKTDATSKIIGDIADASVKQAESVKGVLEGMNSISLAVNQISDSARECADSSEELATQAVMLHNTVDSFIIDKNGAKKPAARPATTPPARAPQPTTSAPAPAKPAPKPAPKPVSKPASIALDEHEEKKAQAPAPAPKPAPKPAAKPAPAPAKTEIAKPAPAPKAEPAKPAPKPAPAKPKPASITLDDNEEKKAAPAPAKTEIAKSAAKPAPAKPDLAKPAPAPAKPAPKPAKPASIALDDNEAKKAAPAPAAKPAPKPAPAPSKPAAKPVIKQDDVSFTQSSSTAPVSRATMQPVKRTIPLDNNKY